MDPAEQGDPSSEGPIDIPDNMESSDSQRLGLEDESDGGQEKDEDYRMELDDGDNSRSNLGSDGEFYLREDHEPKKPGKVKAAKVSFYFVCL
jgi:hypothetical protein